MRHFTTVSTTGSTATSTTLSDSNVLRPCRTFVSIVVESFRKHLQMRLIQLPIVAVMICGFLLANINLMLQEGTTLTSYDDSDIIGNMLVHSTAASDSQATPDPTSTILLKWDNWQEMENLLNSIWGGSRFCTIIKERLDQYYREMRSSLTKDGDIDEPPIPIPNLHLHYEFSCTDLYKYSAHGTGNYIQVMYMMRMAVKHMTNVNIKLNISCTEQHSREFYTNYLLPWFTGVWYTPTTSLHTQRKDNSSSSTTIDDERYCGHYQRNPTAMMYKEMQYDVRRMVISLVGTNPYINDDDGDDSNHRLTTTKGINRFLWDHVYEPETFIQAHLRNIRMQTKHSRYLAPGTGQVNFRTTTIIPLLQLQQPNNKILFDEAVIHFRCGDLLSTDLSAYGFLTFRGYSRHISSTVRSIGILTQPFGSAATNTMNSSSAVIAFDSKNHIDQERALDTGNVLQSQRCRTLVFAFQRYLQQNFPTATIHIRNDRTETITLAYARMVVAKQVVGSMSTFSIYPILSTFGTGYYLRPKIIDPSFWVVNDMFPVTNISDLRTVIFDENENAMLLGRDSRERWNEYGDEIIVQWFRTGRFTNTSH